MNDNRLEKKAAAVVLLCLVLLCALEPFALAQDLAPAAAAPNPNGAALAGWCALGYAIIGAIVSAVRPDNTALPITVPTNLRVAIAAAGGVIEAALLAIVNGTPWAAAIGASVVSVIAALGAHGAPHIAEAPGAPPAKFSAHSKGGTHGFVSLRLLAAGALLWSGAVACSLFTPANAAAVAMIDGAVCHLASEQRSEAAWESFVCKIIDPLGKEASFRVDVPKEQAKSFGKAHAPRAGVRGS